MIQGLSSISSPFFHALVSLFGLSSVRKSVSWRRSQVAKAEVCKTFIQRFESARRLQLSQIVNCRITLVLLPGWRNWQTQGT